MQFFLYRYVGSERISAKNGTALLLGRFPATLLASPSEMPNLNVQEIRNQSNETVTNAEKEVTNVHNVLEVDVPPMNSIVETDKANFSHTGPLDYHYFHPDHLGSSSYITNLAGNVSQHMEYLPFGETLVDEHLNSRNSPFKYNGKEFDEETGNYYYGARYYDPKWSIWVSVDPLVEKTMDAYVYCYQNPINLIDPDGKLPKFHNDISHQSDDEPPVNFFRPTKIQPNQAGFNLVFAEANKKHNYKSGDGIFTVYGHGGPDSVSDNKGAEKHSLFTAEAFDNVMIQRSLPYKKMLESKKAFTLILYTCQSATEYSKGDISFARKMSKLHKNSTIIGFDGYVMSGKLKNGIYGVSDISSKQERNLRDGDVVIFKNGEEIYRERYSKFVKSEEAKKYNLYIRNHDKE